MFGNLLMAPTSPVSIELEMKRTEPSQKTDCKPLGWEAAEIAYASTVERNGFLRCIDSAR